MVWSALESAERQIGARGSSTTKRPQQQIGLRGNSSLATRKPLPMHANPERTHPQKRLEHFPETLVGSTGESPPLYKIRLQILGQVADA